jgi:hypothetical protein
LSEQFEAEKNIIHSHHPGAEESWVREESFITDVDPVVVKCAEFRYTEEFSHRAQPVISQLYLFEMRGWLLKYRLTFAEAQAGRARDIATSLLRTAPWARRAR